MGKVTSTRLPDGWLFNYEYTFNDGKDDSHCKARVFNEESLRILGEMMNTTVFIFLMAHDNKYRDWGHYISPDLQGLIPKELENILPEVGE